MIDTARVVADASSLDELLGVLADEPRYALDTEFHRERTYHPKVALVQFAWPGGIALVDPLAVDIRHLVEGEAALAFDGRGGLRLLKLA